MEFSIAVMALWLIAAATLDLGRAFAAAHVLQSAARSAARELALQDDLPWNAGFELALSTIYDPDYLVIDVDCLENNGLQPRQLLAGEGRRLNQLLIPLMINEQVSIGGQDWRLLRYPGALLERTGASTGKPCTTPYIVGVPHVDDTQSRITLHPVVEELEPGTFGLDGTGGAVPPGTAGVRLNYPFQAVGLSSWRIEEGVSRADSVGRTSSYALDGLGTVKGTTLDELEGRDSSGGLAAYARAGGSRLIPVYGGSLGLGEQYMLGRAVRPFRRLISAQAAAPRQVVQ